MSVDVENTTKKLLRCHLRRLRLNASERFNTSSLSEKPCKN